MRKFITNIIDFFYPLFSKVFDKQTFRYAACGGSNMVLDILMYYISYHYVFKEQLVYTPITVISPHIAAFLLSFIITFPIGFLLNKLVVFTESSLRGRVQLIRYFSVVMVSILLNIVTIKLLVDVFEFYPTVSKIIVTFILVLFSYLMQRNFTFKEK